MVEDILEETDINITANANPGATVTQIAIALRDLYIGNNNTIEIGVVRQLILTKGSIANLSDEVINRIALRMEAIRRLPLEIAELQQRLVDNCLNNVDRFYIQRLFDGTKVPIENSYINLSILETKEQAKKEAELKTVSDAKSVKEQANYRDERTPSHEDLFNHKKPIKLSELFAKRPNEISAPKKLVVLGRAGIGKSIFCQYLAVRWHQKIAGRFKDTKRDKETLELKAANELKQIPWLDKFENVFWIKLREAASKITENPSLEEIISLCCLHFTYDDAEKRGQLKNYLRQHADKCLFILDGYDEIQSKLNDDTKLQSLWKSLKEQPNIILTSRPRHGLENMWPQEQVRSLEIMGFTNENIENYVTSFMQEQEHSPPASELLSYLKIRPSIWGMAHIPINLEMICWLYREKELSISSVTQEETLNTMSSLYARLVAKVVEKMVTKHDISSDKLCNSEGQVTNEIAFIANNFLELLAYSAMKGNKLLIPKGVVKKALNETLTFFNLKDDISGSLKKNILDVSCKLGFIKSTGLGGQDLHEQSYYFIHLSLQEYFAARYIAGQYQHDAMRTDTKESHESEVSLLLKQHKYAPHLQLMWWLTAGELHNRGYNQGLKKFFNVLMSRPRDLSCLNELPLLMHCVEEAQLSSDIKDHCNVIKLQCEDCCKYLFEQCYTDHVLWYQLGQTPIFLNKTAVNVINCLLNLTDAGNREMERCMAIKVLGNIGPALAQHKSAIAVLLKLLEDRLADVSCSAAKALGNIGPALAQHESYIQTLLNLIRKSNCWNNNLLAGENAAKALGSIGPALEVMKGLLELSMESSTNVRRHVCVALSLINSPTLAQDGEAMSTLDTLMETLVNFLADDNYEVYYSAADALNEIGPTLHYYAAAMKALQRLLENGDEDVRGRAAEVFDKINRVPNQHETAMEESLKLSREHPDNDMYLILTSLQNNDDAVVPVYEMERNLMTIVPNIVQHATHFQTLLELVTSTSKYYIILVRAIQKLLRLSIIDGELTIILKLLNNSNTLDIFPYMIKAEGVITYIAHNNDQYDLCFELGGISRKVVISDSQVEKMQPVFDFAVLTFPEVTSGDRSMLKENVENNCNQSPADNNAPLFGMLKGKKKKRSNRFQRAFFAAIKT